jgi:hypothetical protein
MKKNKNETPQSFVHYEQGHLAKKKVKDRIRTIRLIQLWTNPEYYTDGFF